MRLAIFGLALGLGTGCAQILGLDGTKLDVADANTTIDAPAVCAEASVCASTTGGSICGQLDDAATGLPLQVAAPTGMACGASTDGPCALQVAALPVASFFAGTTDGTTAGGIDDCGRFTVSDVDDTVTDVAIVFGGLDFAQSATLVLGRPATPTGTIDITAYAVTAAQQQLWATASGAGVGTAYLVEYQGPDGPLAGEQIRVSGAPVGGPPNAPWGVYFADAAFDSLVDSLTMTGSNGTALIVPPPSTPFDLGGFRTGRQCKTITGLQAVPGVVVYVPETGC